MTRLRPKTGEYFSMLVPLLLLVSGSTALGCRAAPDPGIDSPPIRDVTPAAPAADRRPSPPADLDALLERIEIAGRDLSGLSGSIVYQKKDGLLNRRETRTGTFAYAAGGPDARERLGVRFDQLIVNSVRRPRAKRYCFDGIWLLEVDEGRRTVIRRQIAPEDDAIRALEGGGPLPLLAGRTRSELLARYTVERFDPASSAWTRDEGSDIRPVESLRLVPRGGSEAQELASIDMVLDRETLLPRAVIQTETGGDIKFFRFRDLVVDPPLDDDFEARVSTDLPTPLPEGWKVHVEPLADAATGADP